MQHGSEQNSSGNRRLLASAPGIVGYGERVKRRGTTNGGEEIFCW